MRLLRTLTSVLAITPLLLAGPLAMGTASASPSGDAVYAKLQASPNPASAYAGLSSAEHSAFDREFLVASIEQLETTASALAPAAVGARSAATSCWEYSRTWGAKNAIGGTLYTWWMRVRWCSNGTRVTYASTVDRGGETKTIGWQYVGHGGAGSVSLYSENRRYVQEKFKLQIGIVTVQSPTECGQLRVGTTYSRHSGMPNCNLYA